MSETLYNDIRSAFATRLKSLEDAGLTPEVAWENLPFEPVVNVPYLAPALLMGDPTQATLGPNGGENEEVGIYQITCTNYPDKVGTADILGMASLIRDRFKRTSQLNFNGVTATVRKVSISPVTYSNTGVTVVVSISFYVITAN